MSGDSPPENHANLSGMTFCVTKVGSGPYECRGDPTWQDGHAYLLAQLQGINGTFLPPGITPNQTLSKTLNEKQLIELPITRGPVPDGRLLPERPPAPSSKRQHGPPRAIGLGSGAEEQRLGLARHTCFRVVLGDRLDPDERRSMHHAP